MGGYVMHRRNRFIIFSSILVVLIGVIVVLNFSLQQKQSEPRRSMYVEDGKPIIGLSFDAVVIERWQKDINILKTKAEELGFDVKTVIAYESNEKQVEQIRTLVNEGAVAIFILPHDKDGLAEVIAEAKRRGVIIIAYDRLISNANVDAYVSFDNLKVGELMAKALVDKVPKGNYVIINGSPSDHNAFMFNDGYYKILQPYIDRGDIKIIKETWANNWNEDFAIDTVASVLDSGETIDAIIGANDRLAEGAISVLSEYGLVGKVYVVGHDADIRACQLIVEDKQLMTVYKPIKNLAEGSVELVYAMLNNEQLKSKETINDGKYDVPYLKFGVIAVDKSNMKDTIVKDLFHTEEDIYRTGDN